MEKSSIVALGLTTLIVLCCSTEVTCFLGKVLREIDRVLCQLDDHIIQPFVEPLKKVAKAIGIVKVKKTYKQFKEEVKYTKVVFTPNSYRVEKITPCAHGHHDIVNDEKSIEIQFQDQNVSFRHKYCRKCGQILF